MILSLSLLALLSLSPKEDVTVLAAASLKAPLNEIAREFEGQYPTARILISYAGSQELAAQINFGAQADAFFSADRAQMDVVVESKKVDRKEVRPFA